MFWIFWGRVFLYKELFQDSLLFLALAGHILPTKNHTSGVPQKYCKPRLCASNHLQMCNVVCSVHVQEVQCVLKVFGLLCTCRRYIHIDLQIICTEMLCPDSQKGHMGNFDFTELCSEGASSLQCFKHYASVSFPLGIFLKCQ